MKKIETMPDLPEIIQAGFGLTEALALWSKFQNCPIMTPADAREYLKRHLSEDGRLLSVQSNFLYH